MNRPCRLGASALQAFFFSLDCPTTLTEDLVTPLVALGIWTVGLVIWFKNRASTPTPVEFFLTGAGVLTDSLLGRSPGPLGRLALRGLYSLAVTWTLALLLPYDLPALRQLGWLAILRVGIRLNAALAVILAVLLILREYWREGITTTARRHLRFVASGTLFAFAPLLLLALLPDTLDKPVYIPYEWTFPWLLLNPLAYGSSLCRRRLLHLENSLNHAAVYYLLVTLFLGAYLIAAALFNTLLVGFMGFPQPLLYALVGVGLLLLFAPLHRELQKLVNWVFYGNEVNYADVVAELTQELTPVLASQKLEHLLTDRVAQMMHLSGAILFLRNDLDDPLSLAAVSGFNPADLPNQPLPEKGHLVRYLKGETRPVSHRQINQALATRMLQPEEKVWLAQPNSAYWLPLVAPDGILQGILLLGPRQGDEFFTAEDERTLTTPNRPSVT